MCMLPVLGPRYLKTQKCMLTMHSAVQNCDNNTHIPISSEYSNALKLWACALLFVFLYVIILTLPCI